MFEKLRQRRRLARVAKNNDVCIDDSALMRVYLGVDGQNNRIRIGKIKGVGPLSLNLYAESCEIIIEDGVTVGERLDIVIGQDHPNFGLVRNARIIIRRGAGIGSCDIVTYNSNSSIVLDEDSRVAFGVSIFNTDAHPVYDMETGKLLNKVREVYVGKHVWLGAHATVLKNTRIAEGCIIGWGSVVSGRFDEPHVAIGGNPAKVISKPGKHICFKDHDPEYVANEV